MANMTLTEQRYYTADEFWDYCQLPENQDRRIELLEGEIISMPFATLYHGIIAGQLTGHLGLFIRQNDLGVVTAAGTGFVMGVNPISGKESILAPDIAFIRKDRVPQPIPPTGYGRVVPDLVVEVVSPNDKPDELEEKIVQYLRAGVRLVWALYPRTRTILAHTADKGMRFDETMSLDGGDVLPGFTLSLAELFKR